jgi:hypothetical protein
MPLQREKNIFPFAEKKNNKKGNTWWEREETTHVACSDIERNFIF